MIFQLEQMNDSHMSCATHDHSFT